MATSGVAGSVSGEGRVREGSGGGFQLLVHSWTHSVGSHSIRNVLQQLPQDISSRQAELFCLFVLFIAAYLRLVCNNFFRHALNKGTFKY